MLSSNQRPPPCKFATVRSRLPLCVRRIRLFMEFRRVEVDLVSVAYRPGCSTVSVHARSSIPAPDDVWGIGQRKNEEAVGPVPTAFVITIESAVYTRNAQRSW